MSDEFLCARCAKHQKTCCQNTDIFVTLGDVRRISNATRLTDFTEYRAASDPAYDQTEEDPFWQQHVFLADGTRRVLVQQANGDCSFLGSQGCVLSETVRPLICRLFPFDYTKEGLKELPAGGCPVDLLGPQQQLFQALEMNRERAEHYRAQLYAELTEDDEIDATSESRAA